MKKLKIKTGDIVRIIAGDHKGSEGKVLKLFSDKDKAIVEGINVVKRHTKPNAQNPQGGIVEKEASIHISNLSLLTTCFLQVIFINQACSTITVSLYQNLVIFKICLLVSNTNAIA